VSTLNPDRPKMGESVDQYRNVLRRAKVWICVALCILSVGNFARHALGAYNNVEPILNGIDFLYLYSGGYLWNQGGTEYNNEIFYATTTQFGGIKSDWVLSYYYYLPPSSALFSLFAQVSYLDAFNIYWFINIFFTILATVMMGFILSWYRPIGWLEVTLLCIFLNTPYARTSIEIGQLSAPIFVVILGSFILYRYKRHLQGAALLSLLIVKFSFLPLYLGYYLLKRHYRAVVVAVVICLLLCILPLIFAQRPIAQTVTDWLDMAKLSQSFGTANSPNPFEQNSLEHLDLKPLMYRVMNSFGRIATVVTYLIIAALVAYSGYLMLRSTDTLKSLLLDFALISMLSLMIVYHRFYDVFMIFPALLYIYIHTQEQTSPTARRRWAIFLIVILVVIMLPRNITLHPYYQNPSLLQTSYIWRLIAPYQAWCNVVVLGALIWLKRQQVRQQHSVPVTVETAALSST
jgi:hypothetical protein